jgi:selenocysteine-specific elongation factor
VLTGTLVGGQVALNDELMIQPGHRRVRVRGLQSHHRRLDRAEPGRRLAVNITGVSHHEVTRGQALVRPGQWHLTAVVDASLQVLDSVEQPVSERGAFAAYIGSGDFPVRLRVIGPSRVLEPGQTGAVRLWLGGRVPLPLLPGDRYVLRELGRAETVGGGRVLDVDPVLPPSRATPTISVDRVIAERGSIDADDLERLTGVRRPPTVDRWVIAPAALDACRRQILDAARTAGPAGVDVASLSEIQRAVLAAGVPDVIVRGDRVLVAGAVTVGLSSAAQQVLATLEASPWAPPDVPLKDRAALRELERAGLAVDAGGLWFSSNAVDAAIGVLASLLAKSADGVTVSAVREELGTTRKYVLPLLAYFDGAGVTRRRGDLRVAGPRLAPKVSRQ